MPGRTRQSFHPFAISALVSMLLSTISLLTAGTAWSQPPLPPSQATAPQAAAGQTANQSASGQSAPGQTAPGAPAKPENPGLIDEISKLFHKLPSIKSPSETLDDLNERAKDATRGATETLTNLARPSSMVSGRALCPVSGNGAPDCKAAADKLCQDKGYKEGKSLTMDSAEKCSAKVLIPGRTRKPDDCRTDNYVTAALCQ